MELVTQGRATIRMLGADDGALLDAVAPDVFDHALRPELVKEFLADPRLHIAVAIEEGVVVGFASGMHYVHPDKAPELFVNEVGVAPSHQRRGLGTKVLRALLEHGRSLGCGEAWLGTELDNGPARALYKSMGAESDPDPFVQYRFRLDPR